MNYNYEKIFESKKNALILLKYKNELLKDITVTEASILTGLSFKDSENALHYLIVNYGGYLDLNEKKEIIFLFPNKFNDNKTNKIINKSLEAGIICLKFASKLWITVVIFCYAFFFVLFFLFYCFFLDKNSSENKNNNSSLILLNSFLRLIFDSFYWFYHPFSPFKNNNNLNNTKTKDGNRFYNKVNNFFFGPDKDTQNNETIIKKKIISKIIANHGVIGVYDIIKITGNSKIESNKILSNLLLEYNGSLEISNCGTILYIFDEFKKTSLEINKSNELSFFWEKLEKKYLVTGNSLFSNTVIFSLNTFNIFASSFFIYNGITLNKINYVLTVFFSGYVQILDYSFNSIPILLGWLPFCFSLILFAFPFYRYLNKNKQLKKSIFENGSKGFLKAVYENLNDSCLVSEKKILEEWKRYTGNNPTKNQILECVIKYGGELEINNNEIYYKFNDLFYEMKHFFQDNDRSVIKKNNIFSSTKIAKLYN